MKNYKGQEIGGIKKLKNLEFGTGKKMCMVNRKLIGLNLKRHVLIVMALIKET